MREPDPEHARQPHVQDSVHRPLLRVQRLLAHHLDALQINEVPSYERRRISGTSNLRAIQDGWRILKVIMREKFSDFREPDLCGLGPTVPIPVPPAVLAE